MKSFIPSRERVHKALSVPAFGILYLFTTLMIVAGMPFLFLRSKHVVRSMMRFWAKGIFFLLGKKIEIKGKENLSAVKRYILVANHSSLFDIVAIVSVVPDLAWFGHERLMKIPVFRRVLILTDYIPMRKSTVSNTKAMINELIVRSRDRNIAIFPEGTRTINGRINDFYRGFIILLRTTDVNVLPVTLNGFFRFKPKIRSYIDFSARLEMIIHRPIDNEELVKLSDNEIALRVKSVIESELVEEQLVSFEDIEVKPEIIKK